MRRKREGAKKYLGSRKMRGGQAFLRRMFNRCFGGRCAPRNVATVGVDLNIPIKRGQDIHVLDYINAILDQAIAVKGGPFKKGSLNDDAIQLFMYLRDHRINNPVENSEYRKFINKHAANLAGSTLMHLQKERLENTFFKSGDQNNNGTVSPTLLDICKEAITANFKRVAGEMKSSSTGVSQDEMDEYMKRMKARVDGEFGFGGTAPLPVGLVPPPGYGAPPAAPTQRRTAWGNNTGPVWSSSDLDQKWGGTTDELNGYMGALGRRFNAEQRYAGVFPVGARGPRK